MSDDCHFKTAIFSVFLRLIIAVNFLLKTICPRFWENHFHGFL